MRVLLINDSDGEFGGAEQVLLLTKELLISSGNHVHTFRFSEINRSEKLRDFIYKERSLRPIRSLFKAFVNPILVYKLRAYIRKVRPDLVHLHKIDKYPVSVLMALPKDVPVVYTVHDFGIVYPGMWGINPKTGRKSVPGFSLRNVTDGSISLSKYFLFFLRYKLIPRLLKVKVSYFIAPSRLLADDLSRMGYKDTVFLPNSVADIHPKEDRSTKGKEQLRFFLTGLSTISKLKGTEFAIYALSRLVKKSGNVKLYIIGSGPERLNLEALSRTLGVEDKVVFLGFVPHKDVGRYLRKAVAFILPSVGMENCPLTILEAMAAGIPTIASRMGGIPELVVDRVTGILVEPRDPLAIAKAMRSLLINEVWSIKMGAESRRRYLREYTPKAYYVQLMRVYRKVVHECLL